MSKKLAMFTVLVFFIAAFVLAITARASDWYYYEPIEIYEVYPTLPGTDMRDYSQSGYRIEIDRYDNEQGYPTLPGTDIRDYSRPGYRIDRR